MNNVKDFGAYGDGIHKDTEAVQKAIDAGGTVYFPSGTYLCGTLYLRSNGGLELEAGATLLASPDQEDYNRDDFCPQNETCPKEHVSGAHFIVAVEQENIFIRGNGRIDGNRKSFTDKARPDNPNLFAYAPWRPSQMIFFCECRNISMHGCEYLNAPYWTILLHGCKNADINSLYIYNDRRTLNGDGLDIDCCCDVCVSNCRIDTGDDCITLRANNAPLKNKIPCERVTISNCILKTRCNAMRIGVGNGIIRNCVISNIITYETMCAICIVSSYSANKSVEISNLSFSNMQLDAGRAIAVKTWHLRPLDDDSGKTIRNISFNQVNASCDHCSFIAGNSGRRIENITFDNIHFEFHGGRHLTEDSDWRQMAPVEFTPAAFHVENADAVRFSNVSVQWMEDHSADWQYGLSIKKSNNVSYERCDFGKPITLNKGD